MPPSLESGNQNRDNPTPGITDRIYTMLQGLDASLRDPELIKYFKPFMNALREKKEGQESAADVLRGIIDRVGDAQRNTRELLIASADMPEKEKTKMELALDELNALAKKPDEFHKQITLTPAGEKSLTFEGGAEVSGKTWMRVHLSKDKKPKKLVIVINGNNSPLSNARPLKEVYPDGLKKDKNGKVLNPKTNPKEYPLARPEELRTWAEFPQGIDRSTTHIYDRLVAEHPDDYDVIHLRVGDVFATDPRLLPPYVQQVATHVLDHALSGQGVFKDRKYTGATIVGNSHGAGLTNVLADNWPKQHKVPLEKTAFIDGVDFGKTSGIVKRPAGSGKHLQMYQTSKAFWGIRGYELTGDQVNPGDENVEINRTNFPAIPEEFPEITAEPTRGITHRNINNGNHTGMPTVYDRVFKYITDKK